MTGRIWRWLDERLELEDTFLPLIRHPIPRSLAGRAGWMYIFGSSVLVAFIVQVVTGVALAMTYVPSTDAAYDSLQFISSGAPFGNVLRGIHFFGASAMVLLMVVHLFRVFLTGSYKFPRELNWLSGSLLFLMTVLMAFTGQTLRWDQDAFWAVVVGAEQAARTPLLGSPLAQLLVAGPSVGAATLTRFYATHVFIVPGAIFGLLFLHLYLVVKRGISEPPVAGEPVEPATYRQRYAELLRRGVPYFPDEAWRDAVAAAVLVAILIVLALAVGAPMLGRPPDPTIIVADPRPDWYFIGYFAILALMPSGVEAAFIIGIPLVIFAFLFLLPFIRSGGERHPRRRPLAVFGAGAVLAAYAALTGVGFRAPWVPLLPEGAQLPAAVLAPLDEQGRRGAQLFIDRSCWSCHQVSGSGGQRGPDLTHEGSRLGHDQIITRIANGGGGMPAYAGALSSADLAAITSFLEAQR
ncbi:MAG: cytochrome b N-terminal domain-containing protein [Chloroflexota bacterium]|nr:cytochrome b N-terminal domain-containing protein [Chloroflexota bacterium]